MGKFILSKRDKYIAVKFDSCEKTFVYPDAFEKFLTLEDGTVSNEIINDLNKANSAKQQIIAQKNEENVRAMTRGIVIPGKEFTGLEGEEEENRLKNNELEEI